MEIKWIKSKNEITDEKLNDLGIDKKSVKIRKGKSHHAKAQAMLRDKNKEL